VETAQVHVAYKERHAKIPFLKFLTCGDAREKPGLNKPQDTLIDAAVKGHRVGQSTIENAQRMCYMPCASVYPGSCQPLLTKAYASKPTDFVYAVM
jgi:hypothetical protein